MAVGSVTHSNRGKALEIAIEQANAQYEAHQVATVQKVAVPTKARPNRRTGEMEVIRQKSTVDFIGAWQGRPIAFDAKETREAAFPLKNVHDHQVAFLANWEAAGGTGFLLIYMAVDQAIYLLPYDRLEAYLGRHAFGGRASIPAEELRRLPKCHPGRGCTVDYLAALDGWIRQEGAHAHVSADHR